MARDLAYGPQGPPGVGGSEGAPGPPGDSGVVRYAFNRDFGTVAVNTGLVETQAVVGVFSYSVCVLNCIQPLPAGVAFTCRASADDLLEVRFITTTAAPVPLGLLSWRLAVLV